jgi:uncharacterized protein (PEP-CTERM system associated)
MAIKKGATKKANFGVKNGAKKDKFFLRFLARSLLIAPLLASSAVLAGEWRIVPSLYLAETYTDNVGLSPPGDEESDFITQVTPELVLLGRGARFRTELLYRLQTLTYADDSDRNQINHQLEALAQAEWINDFFFTDADASISQQNTSLRQITVDNTVGDQEDVRTFLVSPYIQSRIGSFATYELRYTYDYVDTSGNELGSSHADRLRARLNSGPRYQDLLWGLDYQKEKIDFNNADDVTRERAEADLRYFIIPRFALLGAVGYEDSDFVTLPGVEEPEGTYWNVGFAWAPTPRTEIEARVGERYFGDTKSLSIVSRARRIHWRMTYTEDVTTTRENFFLPATGSTASFLDAQLQSTIPDPVERAQAVQQIIAANGLPPSILTEQNFFTEEFFLQKAFRASVGLEGRRNRILADIFHVTSEQQSANRTSNVLFGSTDFALSREIEQRGGGVLWSLRLGPRTTTNVDVGYTRNDFTDSSRTDDYITARANITRRLRPNLVGTVEVRRQELDSDAADSDYKENAITVSLRMIF